MDNAEWMMLGVAAATLTVSWLLDWCVRAWRRVEQKKRQDAAAKVLKTHGMETHLYLSSFACEDDDELRKALEVFDYSSRLVLDRQGCLVGRVLPTVKRAGPNIRLVVDNTRPM